MPTFALWSAHDGVVAVASARGLPHDSDRQVEVDCGHMGFAYAPTSDAAIVQAMTDEVGAPGCPLSRRRSGQAAPRATSAASAPAARQSTSMNSSHQCTT